MVVFIIPLLQTPLIWIAINECGTIYANIKWEERDMFLRRKADINAGLEEYRRFQHAHGNKSAVLLDVRTPSERKRGWIPGSVHLPLNQLKSADKVIPAKDTPVFVYCASGGRANSAAKRLRRAGYTNVKSIGGVQGYFGEVERG